MNEIKKFDLNQSEEIKNYYEEFGYVVIKNAISESKIENFTCEYKKTKKNPLFVFYSQSMHVCMRIILTTNSYIKESMQNSSRLAFFRHSSKSFQSCLNDKNVSRALIHITGSIKHVSWQNMFFDKSTGTVEHQDSWYLDASPPGGLVGAWYALEDITKESGPFFVMPKSHKQIGYIDRKKFSTHQEFVDEVKDKISKNPNLKKKLMCINKEDMIFWRPFLFHGAENSFNEKLSRKSFASHFYPNNLKAKNTEKGKFLSIYIHTPPKKTTNENIEVAYKFSDYFYNVLVYALYFKNVILSQTKKISMRGGDYLCC